VAASGAWSAESTYTVKIVLYETPFYSTVNFKFDGDRLLIDSEHNVAFGQTKLSQLVGHTSVSRSDTEIGSRLQKPPALNDCGKTHLSSYSPQALAWGESVFFVFGEPFQRFP